MTQEELKQFKELLAKARELMPGIAGRECNEFRVVERKGKLVLIGESSYVVQHTKTYSFSDGNVEHERSSHSSLY